MTIIERDKYEYKAPSFEPVEREPRVNIDPVNTAETSRFIKVGQTYKSKSEDKDEISVLITGDLLCQENMIEAYKTKDGGYDFSFCLDYLRPLLKGADFVAGNLETPISERAPYRGEIITHEGPFYCNAPLEYLQALKYAGFDMLYTANNHTIDAGLDGIVETIKNARAFGFLQTGTYDGPGPKGLLVDICGFKVGFVSFTVSYNKQTGNITKEGMDVFLNPYSEENAKRIYDELCTDGAEFVVALVHWGKEYAEEVTPLQYDMATQLSNIGYDFIAGAHPHIIQRVEMVNDTPVIFSMGNLITHMNMNVKESGVRPYTVICQLILKRTAEGIKPTIKYIPCKIYRKLDELYFRTVAYDENLELPEKVIEEKDDFIQRTTQALGLDADSLNLECALDTAAAKELSDLNASLENRRETLARRMLKKTKRDESLKRNAEIIEELKNNKKLFARTPKLIEDETGLYKKMRDGTLQLLYLTSNVFVCHLPKEIDGMPVETISNLERNKVIRLIYVSPNVQRIGKESFRGCQKLESVRLFEGLKVIDKLAFANCRRLTGLILPKGLKKIGKKAFYNSPNLISIKIPSTVTRIGKNAFEGCEKVTIYCKEDSYAGKYARKNNIPVKYK